MARKRVRIRWGRLLIVAVIPLLMIGLSLFSWLLRSGIDQQLLTRLLSEAVGMQVEFDSYTLGRSGQAELQGLRVRFADQEVLKAHTLTASFSWLSLLRRNPEISNLALKAPELTLSDALISEIRNQPKSETPDLSIELQDVRLIYQSEERPFTLDPLQGHFSGSKLQLSLKDEMEGTISWDTQSYRFQFERVSLRVLGSIIGHSFPKGQAALDFHLQDRNLLGDVTIDSSLMEGEGHLQMTWSESAIEGVLQSEGLAVMGYPLGKLSAPLAWDGETLSFEDVRLETEHGGFQMGGFACAQALDLAVTHDKLTVKLSGDRPQYALSAVWDGTRVLNGILTADPWTLSVTNLDGGYLMREYGLDGVGFDFSGRFAYVEEVSGELASEGGRLQGLTVGDTKLKFNAQSCDRVVLTGLSAVADQPVAFEARLADKNWHFTAQGQEIPATLLSPSLGGQVDLEAHVRYPAGENTFRFSYSGDKDYPALDGHGRLTDGFVEFQELRLPERNPPLAGTGTYGLAEGSLDFIVELQDQQILDLWSGSPVHGRLFGQATLQGTVGDPKPGFEGEVRDAIWREIELGTVVVTAEEDTLKANLSEVSLNAVPALRPHLSGSGSVQIEGLPPKLQVTAHFPNVLWEGKNLGRLQASLQVNGDTLIVDAFTLPNISLSGSIAEKSMSLKGEIEKFDLSRLPYEAAGSATGVLSIGGSPFHPNGRFQGSVQEFVYQKTALGDIPLQASLQDGVLRAEVLGLAVERMGPVADALPELKGVLDVGLVMEEHPKVEGRLAKGAYGKLPLPPISATILYTPEKVEIHRLTLEQDEPLSLSGSFWPKKGTFQLDSRLERVDIEPVLSLLPESPSVAGTVSGYLKAGGSRSSATLNFEGSGQVISVSGVAVGSIPKLSLAASSDGSFTLRANRLPASGIEPLRGLYPNLRGLANFQAFRDSRTGTLELSGTLVESDLPNLSFQAEWNGSELKLSSLKAALDPPVVVSGLVKDGHLDLVGVLKGQALKDLIALGGARPSSEIQAHLAGNFRLLGPLGNPTATLVGPISDLRYRNSEIGTGQLNLTINQRLRGELKLDQPYDATLADAAPGSVTQVPAINSILKSAIKARITAVKISGSPSDPQVTPVVIGVGVADKIQVPTEVNLPSIPTQLPGVLEKTGVKIPVLQNDGAKVKIPGTGHSIKIKTGIFR